MQGLILYVMAGYLGQAIWSLVVCLLLFGFFRTYRRFYLRKWALAWVGLATHHAANALALYLVPRLADHSPIRYAVTAVSLVAIYAAVTWLLLGTYELATGHIAGRRLSVRYLVLAFALGLASAAVFSEGDGGINFRLVVRVLAPEVVTGLAFLVAATGVWRVRSRHRGTGPRLTAAAFALYGAQRFHFCAVTMVVMVRGELPVYVVVLGVIDLLLQSLIALGMAVWLFEEERRRALGAAAQLERLSAYDPVTELMNRSALVRSLETACREAGQSGGRLLVAVLNLDRFKGVNESFGQAVGDDLLRRTSSRLRRVMGSSSAVARWAGDEFVVVEEGAASPPAFARRLLAAFERPFELGGQAIHVSARVGVSAFPEDGDTPEVLVRHAGLALVEARRGGEHYSRFMPGMSDEARQRLALEVELRRAVEEDGLDLAYQPIVDMASGEVDRVEALVRWRRADGEAVSPTSFLPVAEIIGVADALDAWVLRRALAHLAAWRAAGHSRLRVAVNLSAQRFQDPSLVAQVEEALRAADVPAGHLDLEITERVAMHQAESSLYTLRSLKDLGVGLTIDDFGTGYSSLSYLRRLPVDAVKIDRTFVEDLDAETNVAHSIVRAVVALGQSLGLRVVAEGVETETQWQVLRAEGCDLGQGFWIFRPNDAEHLLDWLAARDGPGAAVHPPGPPPRSAAGGSPAE